MKKSTFLQVTLASLLTAAMGLAHAESGGAVNATNNNDGGISAAPTAEKASGAKSHKAKKRHQAKHKSSSDQSASGNLDDSQPTAAGTMAPENTSRDSSSSSTTEPTGRYRPDNGTGASAPGTARTDR